MDPAISSSKFYREAEVPNKPSLDDDYEQSIKAPPNHAPDAKQDRAPIGQTLFTIICLADFAFGVGIIVIAYYFQANDGSGIIARTGFLKLVIYGIFLIIFPVGFWIHAMILRWLLGIDDIIAELQKLRSKEK